jgi:hydrogenase maturation protease
VLVLGVGNLLMGDEGVGVHVLRALENEEPVVGVRLLDGGTGGINILMEFDGVSDVILIDATRDGKPAGSITFLQPENVGDLPRGLGAHDFGLKDLFAVSALLGKMPKIHLFTISVEEIRPMCMELSIPVCGAMPEVMCKVRELAVKLALE